MQPRSSKVLDLGLWYLTHQRERAMWWYNRVFMPLAVRFQKPLRLVDGLVADGCVDEVLLVCRKRNGHKKTHTTQQQNLTVGACA